jgi:hypothetical protein
MISWGVPLIVSGGTCLMGFGIDIVSVFNPGGGTGGTGAGKLLGYGFGGTGCGTGGFCANAVDAKRKITGIRRFIFLKGFIFIAPFSMKNICHLPFC